MKVALYLAALVGKVLCVALLVTVVRPGSIGTAEATPKLAQCKAVRGLPVATLTALRSI